MKEWIAWFSVFSALAFVLFEKPIRRYERKKEYSRGRTLKPQRKAKATKDGYPWGPVTIPREHTVRHFLATGTTGSGKTLLQRRFMKEALKELGEGKDSRCLIFDAKMDALKFLAAIDVDCPVYSLNPFEKRTNFPIAACWDVAADITSPARALNLAAAIVPEEKGGANRFFTDGAREILGGVIESFIRHSPGEWTFSDLIFATTSLSRVKEVLARDEEGRDVMGNFFEDERTARQVFSTLVSRTAYFRSVAALWQRAKHKLSLRAWLNDSSLALLGTNSTAKVALEAINQLMFHILVDEIDAQGDSETRRTYIWTDEVRLAGPLLRKDLIPYLCVKARSRGVVLMMAFQDIDGFRDVAGVHIANEIVAQCSYKAFLRNESHESAKWASEQIGEYETLEFMRSDAERGPRTGTLSEQVPKRAAVLPSEFFTLPLTTKEQGLTGYFVGPEIGAMRGWIPPQEFTACLGNKDIDGFIARRDSEQWLKRWEAKDRIRLGLALEIERANPKATVLRLRDRHRTF